MRPSSTPEVVPESVTAALCSIALTTLSSAVVAIVMLGAVVSITSDWFTIAGLPAASVAVTLTAFAPLVFSNSVPLVGVALAVLMLQVPPAEAVVA